MKSSRLLSPLQQRPSTASPFHYHMQSPSNGSASSQRWTLEEVQRAEDEEAELGGTGGTRKRWAHTSPQRLIEKDEEEHKDATDRDASGRHTHAANERSERHSKQSDGDRKERKRRKAERERAVNETETEEERKKRKKEKEKKKRVNDTATTTQKHRVNEREQRREVESVDEMSEFSVEFSRDDDTAHTGTKRTTAHSHTTNTAVTQPTQPPHRSTERHRRRDAERTADSSSSAVSRDEREEREKRKEKRSNAAREAEKQLIREQRRAMERKREREHGDNRHSERSGQAHQQSEKEREEKEEQSWEEALEEEQRKMKADKQHELAVEHSLHSRSHRGSALLHPHSHSSDEPNRDQHTHLSTSAHQLHAATDKPHHLHHQQNNQQLPSQTEPIHSHVHTDRSLSSTSQLPLAELLNLPVLRCPSCSHHYHSPHSSHQHHSSDAAITSSHPLSSTVSMFSRVPRVLSCGHTFCTGCLSAAQRGAEVKGEEEPGRCVACPFGCAATVARGGKGVLGVEVNEAVVALLEEVKAGESHLHHHHYHHQQHIDRHTSEPPLSHHTHHHHRHSQHSKSSQLSASLSLLSHMSSTASSIFCSVHPTHPLTLYCHECSMLICLACISPLFSPTHAAVTTAASIATSLSSASLTSASLHSLPTSHHHHRTSKKGELLQQWRESSLLSSLHTRVAAECSAIQDTLAQLGKRLITQRQLQRDEERRVRERMAELRERLLAMVAEKEEEMVRRLADRRRRAEERVEDERRVLSVECNDLALLLTKAQYKTQLDERRERRERRDGVEERVPGLTREQMAQEEQDVREMRWISDLIRTLAIERTVRSQTDEPAQDEQDTKVQLRLAVGEVAEATRRELSTQCVLIDSVPVSHYFTGVKAARQEGSSCVGGECVLRWEVSAAEAVVEFHVEWMEKRKPLIADTHHSQHQTHPAALAFDNEDKYEENEWHDDDEQQINRLGLASLTQSLLSVSLASSVPTTSSWTRLYTGSGMSCTHAIAHDSVYVYRLRALNAIGCSEWLESEAVQLPSELLVFRYAGDTNGVAYHKGGSDTAGGVRIAASSLHPSSVPLSALCCRRPTTVATLPLPHSYVQVDTASSEQVAGLILTHYTLLDPQHREWKHRHIIHWRLLASPDDRHYTVIHEQRRGQHASRRTGRRGGGDSEAVWHGCEVCVVDVERSRNSGRGYRYFRIEQLGVNGDNDYSLVLGGVELYGLLAV